MKNVMVRLLEAQTSLLQNPGVSAENTRIIEQLHATVPAPVLAHFLRLVAQGRRGVALVNDGVCSQCHLRLPVSQVAALAASEELHVCEQCGSFLVAGETAAAPAIRRKSPRARKYTRQLAA